MTLLSFLVVVLSFLGSACSEKIPFDEVTPFPEVKEDCLLNRLALKFKPQLHISSGCHPYPAVDAKGSTSAGLRNFDMVNNCHGSPLGSQVYGRAAEINGTVGIMYVWYFPRDFPMPTVYIGHHHGWNHMFVWLSSFSENATLLSVTSPTARLYYSTYSPPPNDEMNGTHVKLKYTSVLLQSLHYLTLTEEAGEYQDLIMWDNMTEAARQALEHHNFLFRKAPIGTSNFKRFISKAYPFYEDDDD